MKLCEVTVCGRPHKAKGYCIKHYARLCRGRAVLEPSRFDRRPARIEGDVAYIPLAKTKITALVDREDSLVAERNWSLSRGYPITWVDGKLVRMHKYLLGPPPEGLVTDHINRNRLDNRRSNLRFVPQRVNCENRTLQPNNTSGHTGVTWVDSKQKWKAQIHQAGKCYFLGYYSSLEDAILARKKAETIR